MTIVNASAWAIVCGKRNTEVMMGTASTAQRPQLLLADEPTSSLDPKTSVEIMELLTEQGSVNGIPVLVNIHDVELARRYANRIVGMSGGHVVYDGDGKGLDATMLKTIYGGESWLE